VPLEVGPLEAIWCPTWVHSTPLSSATRSTIHKKSTKPSALSQGLTLAHFRAQLEDLWEHIAHVRIQPEHLRDTSIDYFGLHGVQSKLKLSGMGQSKLKLIRNGNEYKPLALAPLATLAKMMSAEATSNLPPGRGLHSSTFRLNVSIFCGIRWVHDFPPVY